MRFLLDAICPEVCAACDAYAGPDGLCGPCSAELPDRLQRMPFPPDSVRAGFYLGSYAGPVGALLRRAKYGRQDALVRVLAARVARAAAAVSADVIVPVPSTASRRMQRGFDPPEIIAAAVSQSTGVPMSEALARVRGGAQAALARADRAANVRRGWRSTRPVRGRVLLVDDVMTTGATARACADELLGAGAREVWLLVAGASPERASKNFDIVGEIGPGVRA